MKANKAPVLVILILIQSVMGSGVWAQKNKPCKLFNPELLFKLPEKGIAMSSEYQETSDCEISPLMTQEEFYTDSIELVTFIDGPVGSGRYWTIILSISKPEEKDTFRGICFNTTTIGWRTLQNFHTLEWMEDRDGDGWPEFILWGSFAVVPEPTGPDFGLCGWVYRIDINKGLLYIDWELSKELAAEIAAAYRKPLDITDTWLNERRKEIAGYLEEFAKVECIFIYE